MEWYWILLIVLASVFLFLLIVLEIGGFLIAKFLYAPYRYPREEQKEYNHKMGYDLGTEVLEKNDIVFKMRDGYLINGNYDLLEGSSKYCIVAHGDQTSREGALRYALIFRELGFSTIVFDERSHGDNVHGKVTMGYLESQDVKEIVDQVYKRFGSGIILGLQGVSMGAFTVLSSLKHGAKVSFIVSDCAYSDLKHVVSDRISSYHLPVGILLPFVNMNLKLFAGYSFKDCDVNETIKKNQVPILFIHGEADTTVYPSNAKRLYEEDAGKKELVYFKDAIHASSITVDRDKYKKSVESFLKGIGVI